MHKLGLYTKSDITRYRGLTEDYKKEINRLNEEVNRLNEECDKLKEHATLNGGDITKVTQIDYASMFMSSTCSFEFKMEKKDE